MSQNIKCKGSVDYIVTRINI